MIRVIPSLTDEAAIAMSLLRTLSTMGSPVSSQITERLSLIVLADEKRGPSIVDLVKVLS